MRRKVIRAPENCHETHVLCRRAVFQIKQKKSKINLDYQFSVDLLSASFACEHFRKFVFCIHYTYSLSLSLMTLVIFFLLRIQTEWDGIL